MRCKCGKAIKVTSTIKSRVRREPYEYQCSCGKVTYITMQDLNEYNEKKLAYVPKYKERKR